MANLATLGGRWDFGWWFVATSGLVPTHPKQPVGGGWER